MRGEGEMERRASVKNRIKDGKVIKSFRGKCKTALQSPITRVSIAAISERKQKDEKEREPMEMKCYCWGYFLFGVNM